MASLWRWLLIFIITISQVIVASAAEAPNLSLGAQQSDIDLIQSIQKPPVQRSQVFTHAISVIQSLQTAPTCNRLATATLIDSCRTLESKDGVRLYGHNLALDDLKSTFAARLAVCELLGAHASVPSQCQLMAPSKRRSSDESFRCRLPGSKCEGLSNGAARSDYFYAKLSKKQSQQCLAALESKPQWWTSYSNARQNAISVCHASRMEADKDDLLDMHRSMAGVGADLSQALDDTIKRSSAQTYEQRLFTEAVKQMQSQVFRDLEVAQANAQSTLGAFVQNFEDRLSSLFSLTSKRMQQATDDADYLSETIRGSSQDADDVRGKLHSVMTEAEEHSRDLSTAQRQEWQSQQEVAIAVRDALTEVRDGEIAQLAAAFASLQSELRASTQLVSLMASHQSTHNTWLQHLDSAFAQLQDTAISLGRLQQTHAKNQTKLLDDLNARMGETESAFGAVMGKMGSLAAVIDEKTAAVGAMRLFGGVGDAIKWLVMMTVVGVVASLAGRKAAGSTALVFLLWTMLAESDLGMIMDRLVASCSALRQGMPSHSSVARFWPALVPGAAFGMGLVMLWHRRRTREVASFGEKTGLPS